jgi:adenylate cyclase class 2
MQETEAKFYVQDLNKLRAQLEGLGAHLIQERILEINLRFDLPDESLRAEGRVLRLRQDTVARLTYKGASQREDGILSREEIEFTIEDFEKARRIFEALGYQMLVYYEKYRTIYEWNKTHVMLDELPYGNFVEIEGENARSIHGVANQLNLNWETAVATSYFVLFERVRDALDLPFHEISFTNFVGIKVDASHLKVAPADKYT